MEKLAERFLRLNLYNFSDADEVEFYGGLFAIGVITTPILAGFFPDYSVIIYRATYLYYLMNITALLFLRKRGHDIFPYASNFVPVTILGGIPFGFFMIALCPPEKFFPYLSPNTQMRLHIVIYISSGIVAALLCRNRHNSIARG